MRRPNSRARSRLLRMCLSGQRLGEHVHQAAAAVGRLKDSADQPLGADRGGAAGSAGDVRMGEDRPGRGRSARPDRSRRRDDRRRLTSPRWRTRCMGDSAQRGEHVQFPKHRSPYRVITPDRCQPAPSGCMSGARCTASYAVPSAASARAARRAGRGCGRRRNRPGPAPTARRDTSRASRAGSPRRPAAASCMLSS